MKQFRMNSLGHMEELEINDEMTLRDYFAAKAMQALISDEKFKRTLIEMNQGVSKTISKCSYEYADAMMKAREQ